MSELLPADPDGLCREDGYFEVGDDHWDVAEAFDRRTGETISGGPPGWYITSLNVAEGWFCAFETEGRKILTLANGRPVSRRHELPVGLRLPKED